MVIDVILKNLDLRGNQDICKMKINNWTVCVQNRGKWRDVVEKAKTFVNI
jgi:hypothetical protein